LDQDTDISWTKIWLGYMPVKQTKSTTGNPISGQFDNTWIQA
jgi:long-chain fatty acid transport protein